MLNRLLAMSRRRKQVLAVLVDIICLPLVFCVAIALRHDRFDVVTLLPYTWILISIPLVSIPIFIRLGLYRAVIRFIDYTAVYVAVLGNFLSLFGLLTVAVITTQMQGVSRGVFGIYWVSSVMYVVASRFLARGYFSKVGNVVEGARVAIYGAGATGTQLAMVLNNSREYRPVVFIDDNKELQGIQIAGIKVYSPEVLSDLIVTRKISKVLLALPSVSRAVQRKILTRLETLEINTLVTPPIQSLIHGLARVQDVREIGIEDLLGRDQVESRQDLLSECICNKVVMVTGAGGSIGSELCRQIIMNSPKKLILFEISEFALYTIEQELLNLNRVLETPIEIFSFLGSVLDEEQCIRILKIFEVDTVYHAAAYKHVPLVEHNVIQGVKNNALGTWAIANAARVARVKNFVLISTDKAVRPTNVMGATKRLSELILQAYAREGQGGHVTRFCMVRFGNVLGSSGSVVPLFRKQIQEGGPITLTHPEITRYFMTIPEAAQLVLQAGSMGKGGDVFVLDMGEPVKIIDLAKRMVHLSGLKLKVEGEESGIDFKYIGLRPGEKLYEELLIGENVEKTEHPLIMRAKEHEISWLELQKGLQEIQKSCEIFDYASVLELLKKLVVEYKPKGELPDLIWHSNKMIKE